MSTQSNRFVALDAWRGLCACLVVIYHFRITSHIYDVTLIRYSFLFVDFFFVLSGFIIANAYYDALRNGFGIVRFTILRFGRLYPLHFFVIAAFVAWDLLLTVIGVRMFQGIHSAESLVTNLLLLNAMGIHDGLNWNYPSWSIGAEFYSYLVFGIVVVGVVRWRKWVLAGVLVVSLIVLANAPNGIGSHHDFGFMRALYSFCLGFFVWRLHRAWRARRDTAQRDGTLAWTVLEVAVVVLSALYVVAPLGLDARLLTPLFFCGVVFVFAQERGRVSLLLRGKVFVLLGDLSYSIYMIHAFVIYRVTDIFVVSNVLAGRGDGMVLYNGRKLMSVDPYIGDLIHVAYVLAVIALAFLTHKYIEQPGRAYFRRLASAGKPEFVIQAARTE